MKFNMKQWAAEYISSPVKKAMPILSFPGVQLTGHTVDEMVRDGHLQAVCMKAIADKFDTGAAFSLMDLSVEAEAFGSPVHYSEDEVPTVTAALVHDEDEAEALKVPEVGAGRPFSLAGRLLDMTEIMIMTYEDPEVVETVLEKATEFLIKYAQAFKEAGANGIAIAEPAAGLLSPNLIKEFSTPYVKKIRESVEDDNFMVLYHNCGSVIPLLDNIRGIDAGGIQHRQCGRYRRGAEINTAGEHRDRKYRSGRYIPQRYTGADAQRDAGTYGKMLQIPELCYWQRMRYSADDAA